jgi:hypothetical protein
MTDLQDIREKLRSGPHRPPASGTASMLVCLIVSVSAAAMAFIAVFNVFMPPAIPLQPSAGLLTFSGTRSDSDAHEPQSQGVSASQAAAIRTDPAALVGKSAAEIGKTADEVCFKRAQARYPHWSKTPRLTTKTLNEFNLDDMDHFDELMNCLITEAPARYCAAAERRMIVGEIIHYFRAIAFLNRDLEQIKKLAPNFDFKFEGKPLPTAEPDQRNIAAIEMRLREGYLTLPDRDRINASAPPDIRTRLARIEPRKSPCPAPPWWAFWQ